MYYHGTKAERADEILSKGFMKPSIGDHHWLGDGYYFYSDEEYAFRWILIKYTNNFSNEYKADYEKIFEDYSILSAELKKDCRFFSLDNIKNKAFFIKIKNELCQKAEYSERFGKQIKKDGIPDGVVINILFEYMDFNDKYDAVEATFPVACILDQSRLDYLPEKQTCVKNMFVIENLKKCNGEKVPEEFKIFINDYNMSKSILKQSLKESKKENAAKKYKRKLSANYNYKK